MRDDEILELYRRRDERAIIETHDKYASYCRRIALNILGDRRDAEECLQDVLFRLWTAIPPKYPENMTAFIGRITRNLAINRYRKSTAQKRGSGQLPLVLSELEECVISAQSFNDDCDVELLPEAINEFLSALKPCIRRVFIKRYWHMSPIADIAGDCSMSESAVKSMLHRTRGKLKKHLERKSITL